MGKKRDKSRKKKELEQVKGDLLPDRELMSILGSGTLGPAAADADQLLTGPNVPKPVDPDGLYESGGNV
jgi:hypothetical protein